MPMEVVAASWEPFQVMGELVMPPSLVRSRPMVPVSVIVPPVRPALVATEVTPEEVT